MIMLQSTFHLKPETAREAIGLMRHMVHLCQQEHGCLSYEYFAGVSDPNQVVLLQEWENIDALRSHYQTEHMEDFLSKLGEHLDRPVSTRSYISQEESEALMGSGGEEEEEEAPARDHTLH